MGKAQRGVEQVLVIGGLCGMEGFMSIGSKKRKLSGFWSLEEAGRRMETAVSPCVRLVNCMYPSDQLGTRSTSFILCTLIAGREGVCVSGWVGEMGMG